MTYRVGLAGGAEVVFHTLPKEARDALIERATDLAERPWDADLQSPQDDLRYRETTFGDDRGILAFYVDDDVEFVRIYRILWMD